MAAAAHRRRPPRPGRCQPGGRSLARPPRRAARLTPPPGRPRWAAGEFMGKGKRCGAYTVPAVRSGGGGVAGSGATRVPSDDGFDAFYAACYGRLVGQLFAVTGDLHEAEDVVQEALVRAAARWSRLRDYDLPEAWVRRVAVNLAASGLRRARRRLVLLSRLGPPPPAPPPSVGHLAPGAGR